MEASAKREQHHREQAKPLDHVVDHSEEHQHERPHALREGEQPQHRLQQHEREGDAEACAGEGLGHGAAPLEQQQDECRSGQHEGRHVEDIVPIALPLLPRSAPFAGLLEATGSYPEQQPRDPRVALRRLLPQVPKRRAGGRGGSDAGRRLYGEQEGQQEVGRTREQEFEGGHIEDQEGLPIHAEEPRLPPSLGGVAQAAEERREERDERQQQQVERQGDEEREERERVQEAARGEEGEEARVKLILKKRLHRGGADEARALCAAGQLHRPLPRDRGP
mmetsp:Transcript_50019/g.112424  ORF Transcript_50019/g.112424 Transcript_50019/m.112424 type:complete len:278 (+) Transcript_50019:966-1799(+)